MKKRHQLNLGKVRSAIPHGNMKIIAERANVSQSVLSQWFKGMFNSRKIEDCVMKEYEKQIRIEKRRQKRFETLLAG